MIKSIFIWSTLIFSLGTTTAQKTKVSIVGNQFYINGQPTYQGRYWNGLKIEGLLMNSRMVQGIFDDLNPKTVNTFIYPDTKKWDANRNNKEFIAAMPLWKSHGLNSFTLNMQGGSPTGYGNFDFSNPGYKPDGSLHPEYMKRLDNILKKADEIGMVVILGLFYFGQDQNLKDEKAVIKAVDNVINWLHMRKYRNVLIEIANESSYKVPYEQAILRDDRAHELIERVNSNRRNGYKYPATTSFIGRGVPKPKIVAVSDYILIHGNGAHQTTQLQLLIDSTKTILNGKNIPIVINEDDHFAFNDKDNNFKVALDNYVSWGFFDFRRKGEGFHEGYQSMPTDWGINSRRKIDFFNKVAEVTGSSKRTKYTPQNSNEGIIVIQAESTKSPLGEWKAVNIGDNNYVKGASEDSYIEFQANGPDQGPPNSPIEYNFEVPTDGNYRLVMMTSKRLEGARGDLCNDVWVKMEGDFKTACKLSKAHLTDYIKFFQEGSTKTPEKAWHWGYRGELGKHEFYDLIYGFKKDQKYQLTLAGRSQRFSVDYIVLFNSDLHTFDEIKTKIK